MNYEEIKNLCRRFTKKEKVDFFYYDNYTQNINIKNYSLENALNNEFSALKVRTIVNKQVGSYIITKINKENIEMAIKKAKTISKLKKSIPISDFGKDKSNIKIKNDKTLISENISDYLETIKKNLTKEKYFKAYEGQIHKNYFYNFYLNEYTENENSKCILNFGLNIYTKKNNESNGGYSQIFTKTKDIDLLTVINQAKINANNLLNPQNGKEDNYTLIFLPEYTDEILSELILPATNGKLFCKKQSYLHNKLNKQVFSKNFNIYEKPHLNYFSKSNAIDYEGFKTTQKIIIENGVFKMPIFNQESAIEFKKKNTGNGFMDISYTNFIQKPGTKKIENIISETKKGILVYEVMGFHTSNITTGEFSLVISLGKVIENGKIGKTITNLNLTGNCNNFFKNAYFSKEQKFFGNSVCSFMVVNDVKLI